jgi:hypothetical protein
VLELHSIYFWPSVEQGLRELHRVLEIGRLAIGVRMHQPNASRFSAARYGLSEDQVAEIRSSLQSVGYRDIETEQRILSRSDDHGSPGSPILTPPRAGARKPGGRENAR